MFLNTQCCIQPLPGANPDTRGPHWYCDVVAVNFRSSEIFLCEISYSRTLSSLLKRLNDWQANWNGIVSALIRDCKVPEDWPVRPWLFVPAEQKLLLRKRWAAAGTGVETRSLEMPPPLITELEAVVPWTCRSWDRPAA